MSSRDVSHPKMRWTNDLPDEVAEYRKTSRLAVASLLLGVFSWLAYLHPAMWSVPALGVVLAIFGLRSVARQPARVSGRGIALAGLLLSLFSLTYAPSRHVGRERRLYDEAQRVGREWLELIGAGKLQEAHQLRLPAQKRVAVDETLEHFYAGQDGKQALEEFKHDMVVRRLMGDQSRTDERAESSALRVRLGANVSQTSGGDREDIVTQRYIVERTHRDKTEVTVVQLALSRTAQALTPESEWMVLESIVVD